MAPVAVLGRQDLAVDNRRARRVVSAVARRQHLRYRAGRFKITSRIPQESPTSRRTLEA